jgi:hypothetical protein
MRKGLPLLLAAVGVPCLAAYAATHKGPANAAGGKVSISRASARTFLPAPGAPPAALPLRLVNSDDVRHRLTGLRVGVSGEPAGCPSARNLRIVQSSVSQRRPLRIPARGAVTLPAQGISAPTIQLLARPVSQDRCKGARFRLHFDYTDRPRR